VFAVGILPGPAAASGDLVLTVDEVGTLYEVSRDQPGGVMLECFPGWDGLIDRIAGSASVVIEHGGEPDPDPIVLGPRLPDCAEDQWLTTVVECLLSVLSDLPSWCQLVNAALSRVARAPVIFARRPVAPARRGWGGGGVRGHRFQLGGRWVRELPVGIVAVDGAPQASWSLVVPDDFPGGEAVALASHPLVLKLGGLLGLAGPSRLHLPIPRPALGLIRAVAAADAAAFAAAAARLTHTVVTVVGRDGRVIASSAEQARTRSEAAWEPACEAREILLRDEAGLHGAIRLSADRPASMPPALGDMGSLLADLGLVLVTSIHSGRRCRTLENQLVMLSCLTGRDGERMFRRDWPVAPGTARRLVVLRATADIEGNAGTRVLDAVVRAAERTEVINGLSMVMSQGSLIGIYPDTDPRVARHRRSWTEVLRMAGAGDLLTVVVGSAISDIGAFPGQHRLLYEIAKIQQSGSRYFDLPGVAMLEDLGPLAEALGATPGRGFAPFVERVLGDLLDDRRFGGQLIETLYAYLQTGGSLREAGELLHMHASTVKYRMRVIRELLGPRLADQSSRLDIELAVRLCMAARLPLTGPARVSGPGR
jgi:hypothetical protein